MHIYTHRQRWKIILFAAAVFIGVATTWYTNVLVQNLAQEERFKMETWANATAVLATPELDERDNEHIFVDIVKNNITIPVITVDDHGKILSARNLKRYKEQLSSTGRDWVDNLGEGAQKYLEKQLRKMKDKNDPIVIHVDETEKQYLYYKDSFILTRIKLFPLLQLAIIFLFIFVAYFAFSSSRIAEQNQVWVGMSKETAHQLGTPISSLMAWIELMKMKENDQRLLSEVEKDVFRLETIADRFSKIGSAPVLEYEDLVQAIRQSVTYIENRSSNKVEFKVDYGEFDELFIPLNVALFEWVIENLCKNSIDAMDGVGQISLTLKDQGQVVYVDIADSGKGVSKNNYKIIFQPGYTTKPRGWGLGLSLVKRIIENYHKGKIFVKSSELNKGTTFRIVLKK